MSAVAVKQMFNTDSNVLCSIHHVKALRLYRTEWQDDLWMIKLSGMWWRQPWHIPAFASWSWGKPQPPYSDCLCRLCNLLSKGYLKLQKPELEAYHLSTPSTSTSAVHLQTGLSVGTYLSRPVMLDCLLVDETLWWAAACYTLVQGCLPGCSHHIEPQLAAAI